MRGTPEEQRANHWFATFCTALDKDNTQGNDSTITMQETIDALKEMQAPSFRCFSFGRHPFHFGSGHPVQSMGSAFPSNFLNLRF